jgi:hypothetical protein
LAKFGVNAVDAGLRRSISVLLNRYGHYFGSVPRGVLIILQLFG